MKFSFSSAELAVICGATAQRGATREPIRGIAALTDARPGDLAFLRGSKYRTEVAKSQASVVLVPKDFDGQPAADQEFLLVENPSAALARFCARLEQLLWPRPAPGIHRLAVVAEGVVVPASATVGPFCVLEPGVVLGERVYLEAQTFLGRDAMVGDDSWLAPGVQLLAQCRLGSRVRVHSGVVIGADGFGYEFMQGRHVKVPQIGSVEIGDDVEIGANTTIDRARFGSTQVGEGTKIDNLVQIAHNVRVGRHCVLCAQVGVSGSTILGDYVVMGGQSGAAGHVRIGHGAKVGGGGGVTSDVAAGAFVNGNPAIPLMLERRIAVLRHRLPELFRRVDALETQVSEGKKLSPGVT